MHALSCWRSRRHRMAAVTPAGTCIFIGKRGRENLCPNAKFTGYDRDGGYEEFATVREDFAYRIADSLGDEEAGAAALRRASSAIAPSNARPSSMQHDGGSVWLRRLGASLAAGPQVLGMQGLGDDAGRHASRAGREYGRADWVGRAEERPLEKLDAAILFAPMAGNIVALVHGGARSRRRALDRGYLSHRYSIAQLREASFRGARDPQRHGQHAC